MPFKFGTFDLIYDSHRCFCPICREFVEALTCGFTGCYYSLKGIKKESPSKPPIHF